MARHAGANQPHRVTRSGGLTANRGRANATASPSVGRRRGAASRVIRNNGHGRGIVTRSGRTIEIDIRPRINLIKKKSPPTFPFLDLPLEIRMMIYRLLFIHDRPIDSAGTDLSAAFLRTCRQVRDESQPILCGENTFLMKVWAEPRPSGIPWRFWARFLDCSTLLQYPGRARDGRIRRMKRWEVRALFDREQNFQPVKVAVRKLAQILSELPELEYMRIKLDGIGRQYPRVLESLTLLRNVQRVEFEGVPRIYAEYLESKMTGQMPLDHLPKMYEALQNYAGHFEECESSLKEACDAMESDDVEVFKFARANIITTVTKRMKDAEIHLFDHDGKT